MRYFLPLNICSKFNFSDIRFRLKAALDEANEQLDIVRRENKVMIHNLLFAPF